MRYRVLVTADVNQLSRILLGFLGRFFPCGLCRLEKAKKLKGCGSLALIAASANLLHEISILRLVGSFEHDTVHGLESHCGCRRAIVVTRR
jgi:hypothetical protein